MARREFEQFRATIKSPKVFVGDICYALNDDTYRKCWGDHLGFEDGKIPVVFGTDVIAAVTVSTAYGDGCYYDDRGNEFGVDAGNIGVTGSTYFGENDPNSLGLLLDVPSGIADVYIMYEDGYISIEVTDKQSGTILYSGTIPTNEEEEEEDDYYENNYYDDDDEE